MLMANAVSILGTKTPGKESEAIEAFARALRQLPTVLADNAGYDSAYLVSLLRAQHANGLKTQGLGQLTPCIIYDIHIMLLILLNSQI